MKNWKTTVIGALLAAVTAVATYQANGGDLGDWKLWVLPALLAGLGWLAKDAGVTGPRLVIAALLVPVCLMMQASCTGMKKAELAGWANLALTAAEIGGAVNPKQAEAVRQVGVLVLSLEKGDAQGNLRKVSEAAVEYAVAQGKITPEQAQKLREAGRVELAPQVVEPPGVIVETLASPVTVTATK